MTSALVVVNVNARLWHHKRLHSFMNKREWCLAVERQVVQRFSCLQKAVDEIFLLKMMLVHQNTTI
jgi:hypothetical protein